MKTLDLSQFAKAQSTWEVKLLNGKFIHVFKPTQELYIEMTSLAGNQSKYESHPEEAVNDLYDLTSKILSNNKENYKVDTQEGNYPVEILAIILQNYQEFAQEILSDPNLKSPQSPQYHQRKKGQKGR